jgi:hypothetical protein
MLNADARRVLNPHIVCENLNIQHLWVDGQLEIQLDGQCDSTASIHNAICAMQMGIKKVPTKFWTGLTDIQNLEFISGIDGTEMFKWVNDFYEWTRKNGCFAAALIIHTDLLPHFTDQSELTNNAANGVRIFFDKETATAWLISQRKLHRKRKLH